MQNLIEKFSIFINMNYKKSFQISDNIIATKQTRFTNYMVDYLAQIAIFFIVIMVSQIIALLINRTLPIAWLEGMNKIQEYIFGAVLSIFYYSIFESITARSLGKFITNTIVVLKDGTKPPIETILRRSLYRVVPLNALSFLWGDRIWHDKYTDTFVVSKSGLDAEIQRYNNLNKLGSSEI